MITIKDKLFKIDTPNTSYIMEVSPLGYVENLYYGQKISDNFDIDAIRTKNGSGQGTSVAHNYEKNKKYWPDNVCLECSSVGRGDYREPMLIVRDAKDNIVLDMKFVNATIIQGEVPLENMPSSYDKEQTLQITLADSSRKLQLTMYYSTHINSDVIVKRASLLNNGNDTVYIERIMSSQLDLPTADYAIDTLDGTWARERYINTRPLSCGTFSIDSKRGISSNEHNPYIVVKSLDATLWHGDAYGINLIYSGNHQEIIERTPFDKVRILNGINEHAFCWHLLPNEQFDTPEATLCYSHNGTNGLTKEYHNFVNNNIVRGSWKNKQRPILINNWEATYFDFTEKKLLEIANKAQNLGIELFVLDDGWFGERYNDTKGLGDWYVNTKRLSGGLERLIAKINKIGLDFGIWVEPEMVNPDSDLYRKHPDWAMTHPDYTPCLCRNQLLLDYANPDVQDYIIERMSDIFSTKGIKYVKWDFNRPMTDFYSPTLPDRCGEVLHRYQLGLYRVLDTLTTKFPDILFESCASGGNRVDLAMLCYMPQFWTSDNTDSYDRTKIQEGTLTCYPQSTMGCHVSASPNHQTLRPSHIDTRFNTACCGVLGYELDLTELNRVDTIAVKKQIEWYKQYRQTLQFGNYYKVQSSFDNDGSSWIIINDDQTQAVQYVGNGIQHTIPSQQILTTHNTLDDNSTYLFKTRQQVINVKTFGSLINMVSPVHVKQEGKLQQFLDNNFNLIKSEIQQYTLGGDVLNKCGVKLYMQWGSTGYDDTVRYMGDFGSRLYSIDQVNKDK